MTKNNEFSQAIINYIIFYIILYTYIYIYLFRNIFVYFYILTYLINKDVCTRYFVTKLIKNIFYNDIFLYLLEEYYKEIIIL